MNANIVPLTDEETREVMKQISDRYASGELKPEKMTREQLREAKQHKIVKEDA